MLGLGCGYVAEGSGERAEGEVLSEMLDGRSACFNWISERVVVTDCELVTWLTFDMMLLTKEAQEKLQEAFGPDAKICVRDSMSDSGAVESIFVVARVKMSPEQALATMDKLDADWWLDQAERAQGRIHIAFEHRKD